MNCPKCGLPKELCVCEDISKGGQKIRVRTDKRKYGKFVTIVDGFENVDLHKIAKDLKRRLACGGTVKNDYIELQGDHASKAKNMLIDMGFSEDMVYTT